MDTVLRASLNLENINKILIPFNTSNQKKNELIDKHFVIETHFGNLQNIKKMASKKKCHSYLLDNKIIKLTK